MKKYTFAFLSVIMILTFSVINTFAQWEPDVRLTNDPAFSNTLYNNAWCTASNGNFVHTVWFDTRDGNYEIYYKRSTDSGLNWDADTRLTNNGATSTNSSIAVSGSFVHLAWRDTRDGNNEIYYKRSIDGGITWDADTRLTNNAAFSLFPSIAVSGTFVHLAWYDTRDGNNEIYYKRSTDGGITWDADTRLTNNAAISLFPSIAVSGTLVHVVWQDDRDGNYEIYYKRSTDGGITWDAGTNLTNGASNSTNPSIAVTGSFVHLAWRDTRDGNDEIYYKRSTDGGIIWDADTRLTNSASTSAYPSIAVTGTFVHLAWYDTRDGNDEIYYKRSTDGGITWDADTRLTNNASSSVYPSIAVSGTLVHVVWQDDRDGNYEIYYKRNTLIPIAPVLISPVNNSTGQNLNLNLIWNKPQFALKYRVLVATDSLFANVIISDSLLTDSVKSISNLNPLTNYYWKVSAGNGNPAGWSSYSPVYKFRTISMPSQVVLNQPANNSVNQPVNITFKWFKAFDQTVKTNKAVSNYWLEYSVDSNFVSGVVKDSLLTDSVKSVTGLNTLTNYYWRVKAKNIAGWGNFSSIWNFTTAPPMPVAPVLVSPPNKAINQVPNLLLDWSTVQYAASYRVQIANDSLFNTIVYDTINISSDSLRIRPGILTLNTRYFWRVNAVNVSGPGPWSAAWSFTVSPVSIIPMNTEIPLKFSLSQNYPNPFNPVTKMKFDVARIGDVKIVVYDAMGREVQTLVKEALQPGTYEATFDGSKLTSGVYFYKLITGDFADTKKMLLIK